MHKITKGLKKKKNKTKKSKHKEEELFKPEELEAYRREHQQPEANGETSTVTANDEWKKFNALTAGIDTFLKKTQDDLDRIKSTSFFQRVPPPSEVLKEEQVNKVAEEETEKDEKTGPILSEPGIVQISESESEEDNEDDIFDTSYIDALAAAEVKLAYIPESPTEQPEGDDPFDTSIAERAILGPAVTRKGKKLVPLGAAVEVLTGRVQAPTCAPIKRPSTRRTVPKEKNLLLGSFDNNDTPIAIESEESTVAKPSLLDDDTFLPASQEPIDLTKSLHIAAEVANREDQCAVEKPDNYNALQKFDVVKTKVEDDDEFALLAAESLSKPSIVTVLKSSVTNEQVTQTWNAFDQETNHQDLEENDDPFDTAFAENIVPGKFVLRVIEDEILNNKNDLDFNPRANEALSKLLENKLDANKQEDYFSESALKPIQKQNRDLLGGSTTDLSVLGDQPLEPNNQTDENYIEYCDPFDTSVIEKVSAPGQTELKFLEKELLSDFKPSKTNSVSDDEFDPRVDEVKPQQHQERKFSINKSVAFKLPLQEVNDVFAFEEEASKRVSKPLTPYYVRENSLPEQPLTEDELENVDPFDTSFVGEVSVGKAELKVIESLILQPEENLKHSISDSDFNPRDDKQIAVARVVQVIKEVTESQSSKNLPINITNQVDLLGVSEDITAKVLTPAGSDILNATEIPYSDPFDTSIATNILPGKAELKLLETELVNYDSNIKRVLTDPDFDPRNLVAESSRVHASSQQKPAAVNVKVAFDLGADDDIDPFDTSIVNTIPAGQIQVNL